MIMVVVVLGLLVLMPFIDSLRNKPVYIAAFKDDRPAAISLTFDDGLAEHADIVVPLLGKYGLKATFYISPGLVVDNVPSSGRLRRLAWSQVRQMAACGYEIGNHGMRHVDLTKLNGDELEIEVIQARRLIEEKTGQQFISFAYPYHQWNRAVRQLVHEHHLAGREQVFFYNGEKLDLASANKLIDEAVESGRWFVAGIHGVNHGFAAVDESFLDRHFDYLDQHRDQVWIDTFAAVARYRYTREHTELNITNQTLSSCEFSLRYIGSETCPPVELTVVLRSPATGFSTAQLRQGRIDMPLTFHGDCVRVQVRPERSPRLISVTWR